MSGPVDGSAAALERGELTFSDIVRVLAEVTSLSGRNDKIASLASCLAATPDDQIPAVLAWLTGGTRQRRTGLGWAAVRDAMPQVDTGHEDLRPTLTAREVDDAFTAAAEASGAGAATVRAQAFGSLLARATPAEAAVLARLVGGEARTGAAAGLVLEAVAVAAAVPSAVLRRAAMLLGDPAAALLLARHGGREALEAVGLRVGTPVAPMLAASDPTVAQALARTGPAAVEWKLDGIRVQMHVGPSGVRVFTRTLDDITARLPDVVAALSRLRGAPLVLDGEVLAIGAGRPEPFQVSAARAARSGRDTVAEPLTAVVFDVLHAEGRDLMDEPGPRRRAVLESILGPADPAAAGWHAPGSVLLVPRLEVPDPADPAQLEAAEAFAAEASAVGHEGVLVKAHTAGYAMGRRGAGWIKVKPRTTLDLLVVAAEWGHGRRTGLLSNLHLAARDPDGRFGPPGAAVMLGKTFKGLTDAVLTWQTQRLQELATATSRWQVTVRPEAVVEVAFDGVQRSSRYPAGVTLRFARVVRYREDKAAAEADTIDAVLALAPLRAGGNDQP